MSVRGREPSAMLSCRCSAAPPIRSAKSSTARLTDRRENCASASIGRPRDRAALPAILYFHGGGWVMGSLEAYDKVCRFFAARTGCAVVAVDYRLAPEHRFPAAIDDAIAAFRWLGAEAPALGIDPARIVLAGDSAGGTIAAVVAQQVRGDAPALPAMACLSRADLAFDSRSFISFGESFLVTKADMEWTRAHYLKDLRGFPTREPRRCAPAIWPAWLLPWSILRASIRCATKATHMPTRWRPPV